MKRLIIAGFLGLILVLLLGACGMKIENHIDNILYMNQDEKSNLSGTHCLSEDEKMIYDILVKRLFEYETEILLNHTTQEEVDNAYRAVVADYPELFWVSSACSIYSTWEVGYEDSQMVIIKPVISDTMKDIKTKEEELENKVKEIISQVDEAASDYDKVMYVHDYIIDTTDYDMEARDYIRTTENPDVILDSTTAYGCLVNHKAVCSGYSAAFQLLMHQLGVKCVRLSTPDAVSEGHMWNGVQVGDQILFVDTTWDDPVMSDGTGGNKTYDNFCVTLEELSITHIIDEQELALLLFQGN